MADEEHLSILMQGMDVWNRWKREIYPGSSKNIPLPSMTANLFGADLSGMDLSFFNLDRVELRCAKLRGTKLIEAQLTDSYLDGADFSRTDLRGAELSYTRCSGGPVNALEHVQGSAFYDDDEYPSNFEPVNFSEANFEGVSITHAVLKDVSLRNLDLSRVDFAHADLENTDFTNSRLRHTEFVNTDLSTARGLDTVQHIGPSYIDINTIYNSKGNIPEVFLKGAGVPDTFITFMKSLTGVALDFYSCFISHSSQDKAFVERLYADLQAKGVRCWYAPEDLKIGEPFLLGIEQGIRLHDKLLLVLSKHSVASGWVQHEVLSAMAKEQGKEPWVLFPIRVDDAVMNTDVTWAGMIKQSRHIGDFTHWKNHDAYQKAFDRLLRDLKAQG